MLSLWLLLLHISCQITKDLLRIYHVQRSRLGTALTSQVFGCLLPFSQSNSHPQILSIPMNIKSWFLLSSWCYSQWPWSHTCCMSEQRPVLINNSNTATATWKSKNGPWAHKYVHVHSKYLTTHLCNVQYSWERKRIFMLIFVVAHI